MSIFPEVQKLLSGNAKKRGCEALSEWIRPCVNNLHWSETTTACGTGRIIWAKFKSFWNHIINKHKDLDDALFNKCIHREICHRKWFFKGTVSMIHVQNLISDCGFLTIVKWTLTSELMTEHLVYAAFVAHWSIYQFGLWIKL